MAAKPKNSDVEQTSYKDHKIAIITKKGVSELRVDDKPIRTQRDADTGAYGSPELPYREFGSLDELGKAMVDEWLAGGQADE